MIQEQLQRLFDLSQVDAEIAKIRVKTVDAPKRSDELTRQLQLLEGQISEKANRLSGIEKEKSGLESELQFSRDRLAAFESKANQIKTNKEYQAAIKEIAETKNAQKQMEERTLKLTTEAEALQKELDQLSQAYQTDKQTAEEERKNTYGDSPRDSPRYDAPDRLGKNSTQLIRILADTRNRWG
ncbi:MAG: hypothetical protein HYY44_04540, partial [Deltaproteobacteria bacterium]|nr:hypothetical protein [Deltaproteobacteria bacterium]